MIVLQECWKHLICQSWDGFFCVLLAQERKSTGFRIVVSVQPLCTVEIPKACSQAADRPPELPSSSCQRYVCRHAKSCPTSRISPSVLLKSSWGGRSCCMAEELHGQGAWGIYWVFQSYYPVSGNCLSSFVFQAASLNRSPYPVPQASHVHKSLFVTPVSVALFLLNETFLPKPQCTWL